MAIVNLPDGIIISNVNVEHHMPQFVTQSLNLKRTAKDRDIHQLKGTFDITIDDARIQRRFESWLTRMKGRLNQFELELGNRFSASDHLNSVPNVSANTGVGANSIALSNIAGEIWEGDFINFLNDPKVYIIQSDLTSGNGTVNIYPSLRQEQFRDSVVNMSSVIVRAQLTKDAHMVDYTEGGAIHTYSCEWEESL